jgi:hypothetical protein
MRLVHSRIAPLAVAAALAVLISPILGCTCACPKVVGSVGPEAVNIIVTWSDAAKSIAVAPDPVRLCEGRQYPVWILADAPAGTGLGIEFKGDSPFDDGARAAAAKEASAVMKAKATTVRKGVPKPGSAGKTYKYDVVVTLPDGTSTRLDPRVEIWH